MKLNVVREKTKSEVEKEKAIESSEEVVNSDLKEEEVEAKLHIKGEWTPKTSLGKAVLEGKIKSIDEIFEKGLKITEPEIVDALLPNLKTEIILVGGSTGKGGGIRRTPFRRTTRMHKSGRRFKISSMVVVGNENGYIGVGFASGPFGSHREVLEKATRNAKINIKPVVRGCGSWECGCGTPHSIPFAVTGKSGSVRVKLMPAPKGVGLCTSDEVKKVMRLAGIKDIWTSSSGHTRTRLNYIKAVVDALTNLNTVKITDEDVKKYGIIVGKG